MRIINEPPSYTRVPLMLIAVPLKRTKSKTTKPDRNTRAKLLSTPNGLTRIPNGCTETL